MKKIALLIMIILLAGCTAGQFDRKQMVSGITNDVILANHKTFAATTADLQAAAEAFQTAPSDDHLTALREAWQAASVAWMGCAPFEFDLVKDALIHNRIDNRPPRFTFIEEKIASNDPISADVLLDVGSSSQGLSAIEYLIFTDGLTDDPRRIDYLVSAADLLAQNGEALLTIWSADGQNYAQQFIDGDLDGGNIQGSMNMLFNQVLEQIEMITWNRLGKPMGKRSGGHPRPDLVEAPLSRSSLSRIQATVEVLHQVYNGGNTTEPAGFASYLDSLDADYNGEPLSQVIEAQFIATQQSLAAIESPLGEAIEADADTVEAAYQELRTLITLLKVDAANQMGVTLTFNDNDGD